MKITKWNGEYWFTDKRPLFKRIRQWFIHLMGVESPHWDVDGYTYRWKLRRAISLSLRARGHRSRLWAIYNALCPIKLFGRITLYSWGGHIWLKHRYLCWARNHKEPWRVYLADNATPWGATTWIAGMPPEVQQAADKQHAEMAFQREERERKVAA